MKHVSYLIENVNRTIIYWEQVNKVMIKTVKIKNLDVLPHKFLLLKSKKYLKPYVYDHK